MIQQETRLDIADNSGVKSALCIKVLGRGGSRGKYTRPVAGVGDVICVAIKKSLADVPARRQEGASVRDHSYEEPCTTRPDGSYVRFDSNAAVMIDGDGNPIGTRIFRGCRPRAA